jgi:aspartate aminotransferase
MSEWNGETVTATLPRTQDPRGRTLSPHLDPFPAPVRDWIAGFAPHKILEIVNLAVGNPDVIPLWFGESDLPTPEFICAAAEKALRKGQTFYAARRGLPALRQELADHMSRLHGREVSVDRVTVTTGAINGLMLAMQIVVGPGDNVVMVSPAWPNAGETVSAMGGQLRPVELRVTDGRLGLDLDELFAAVDDRTRMIFVNSPNNPTGWVMTQAEQQSVLDFCRVRKLWLLADEVYGRLSYGRKAAPSFLDIAVPNDPLLVVNSFSKTWAMTGWRLGWLVAPKELGQILESLIDYNVSGTPTFIQPAAIAALCEGDAFITRMVEYCRKGRDILTDGFKEIPRVRFAPPEATFYAFFQIDGVTDSFKFAKHLVSKVGVGLAPGAAFGPGGESWFRLCFARSAPTIQQAVQRLQDELK